MRKTVMKPVVEIYCDVCGLPTTSTTHTWELKDGRKLDACTRWWEQKQTRCSDILSKQITLEALAKP